MEVPKVALNISNPKERVRCWNRAHGDFLELGPNVPMVSIWSLYDLNVNPNQFHFHCSELPTNKKWEIRMEWESIWSMMTTYLSTKG